jgi:hypothetical protein
MRGFSGPPTHCSLVARRPKRTDRERTRDGRPEKMSVHACALPGIESADDAQRFGAISGLEQTKEGVPR